MGTIQSDEYECFTCHTRFKGRVFGITREWDRVHFGAGLPEVEVANADGLECYCSFACLEARRDEVMAREGVPIRYPELTPVEICAKCAGIVDMSEYHLTYIEDDLLLEGSVATRIFYVNYLAVVCDRCNPRETSQVAYELAEGSSIGRQAIDKKPEIEQIG